MFHSSLSVSYTGFEQTHHRRSKSLTSQSSIKSSKSFKNFIRQLGSKSSTSDRTILNLEEISEGDRSSDDGNVKKSVQKLMERLGRKRKKNVKTVEDVVPVERPPGDGALEPAVIVKRENPGNVGALNAWPARFSWKNEKIVDMIRRQSSGFGRTLASGQMNVGSQATKQRDEAISGDERPNAFFAPNRRRRAHPAHASATEASDSKATSNLSSTGRNKPANKQSVRPTIDSYAKGERPTTEHPAQQPATRIPRINLEEIYTHILGPNWESLLPQSRRKELTSKMKTRYPQIPHPLQRIHSVKNSTLDLFELEWILDEHRTREKDRRARSRASKGSHRRTLSETDATRQKGWTEWFMGLWWTGTEAEKAILEEGLEGDDEDSDYLDASNIKKPISSAEIYISGKALNRKATISHQPRSPHNTAEPDRVDSDAATEINVEEMLGPEQLAFLQLAVQEYLLTSSPPRRPYTPRNTWSSYCNTRNWSRDFYYSNLVSYIFRSNERNEDSDVEFREEEEMKEYVDGTFKR